MTDSDKNKKITFNYIKNDLPAGLVVFLVALPLCLGIALASGAPLFSGVIAGIVGGIVVGFFSGSALGVSGPAAGLTVIVLSAITSLGSYETFLLTVVIAGILQIVLGIIKAGIIGHYFPSSVIKGMLAAIGLILILKQIPHALGFDKDLIGDDEFMQMDNHNTFSEIYYAIKYNSTGAIIISFISIGILVFFETKMMKKIKLFNFIPGALIVVALGIILNKLFSFYMPTYELANEHLVVLPVASNISEFASFFTFPDWTQIINPKVYITATTIAIVASLETLLCVEATDKLDPQKRNTSTNKELLAQGAGNIVSGLIGGLPVTQVIVRSSANISSGGKTKLSAIFHGLLLLTCALLIPNILNYIPLASLAAVLLVVGYKLTKIPLFKEMFKLGWEQFIPFVVTILAILFTDLLKGIGIGMAVSIFFIIRNNYKQPYFYIESVHGDKKIITLELPRDVTFINKGSIILALDRLPEGAIVTIDGTQSNNIDLDVLEILNNFRESAKAKNIQLELKSIPEFKANYSH